MGSGFCWESCVGGEFLGEIHLFWYSLSYYLSHFLFFFSRLEKFLSLKSFRKKWFSCFFFFFFLFHSSPPLFFWSFFFFFLPFSSSQNTISRSFYGSINTDFVIHFCMKGRDWNYFKIVYVCCWLGGGKGDKQEKQFREKKEKKNKERKKEKEKKKKKKRIILFIYYSFSPCRPQSFLACIVNLMTVRFIDFFFFFFFFFFFPPLFFPPFFLFFTFFFLFLFLFFFFFFFFF